MTDDQRVNHEIRHVIRSITKGANNQGIRVSRVDVGWIVSTFIEAVFTGEPIDPVLSQMMQQLADDCASVGRCEEPRPS